MPTGSGPAEVIAFSPDGNYLATANSSGLNGKIVVFTFTSGVLSNGVTYEPAPGGTSPQAIAFSPNGAYLATGNWGDNTVSIFTVNGGILSNGVSADLSTFTVNPLSIAFSPDSSCLVVAYGYTNSFISQVTAFTIESGAFAANTTRSGVGQLARSIAFSPNGQHVAVGNSQSGRVTLFPASCGSTTSSGVTGVTGATAGGVTTGSVTSGGTSSGASSTSEASKFKTSAFAYLAALMALGLQGAVN
jgi:DNA-binding beta-propeller fold protein YncE